MKQVKSFLKELKIAIYVECFLGLMTLILNKYELLNPKVIDFITKAFLCGLPIFITSCIIAFRLYKQYETAKRHNAVIEDILIDFTAHIITILKENEKEGKLKVQIDEPLKKQLIIAYKNTLKNKFQAELNAIYPLKTKPQIDKMIKEYFSNDNEVS